MKILPAAMLLCVLATAQPVLACGTRLPEVQRQIDGGQLQRLRALTAEWAKASGIILVGTVTALERPAQGGPHAGSVTLAVAETLKGEHSPTRVLAWSDEGFRISCDPTESFNNVGFRDGGHYIVYVKDGRVVRAAAADELRESSLLALAEERALVMENAGE